MKDEKKAPKLRFKGFTDDWKHRKLGDVADRVTTKNKGMVSELPLTISAQDGLISQDEFFNKKVASKDLSSYLLLHHGDFAYNKSYSNGYPFGTIKRLEKYPQGVVSSLYIAFKPNSSISSDFMAQYYESNNWHKEIYKCAAEGARNHGLLNVPPSDFFATNLNIPITKSEQLKIGRLLNVVDQTITLHEEKKRQLERLKSALMQKMFADKSGYPAVRFYGFSDKWEKRKLGDIFEERIEKSHNGSEELLSVTLKDGVVKAESLDRKNNASHDKRNYKLVFPNDIAYNSMRMWQGALGVSKYNGIVSPAYTIIKLKNQLENPYFYQNYFKKYEILNVFRKSSQGLTSDTWNLKYPLFSRIHLFTTSSAEQQNISSLLTLLDYNIALHGYKLELLKKIKKFLLQNVFI